jgi:hypothetical protein
MKRQNFPDRKALRVEEAGYRKKAREKRGPKGQLEKLKREGHGHCKEAGRLQKEVK